MKQSKSSITYRAGKGYTRDLGWKLLSRGQKTQPRFLLGHDRGAAELANAKLEALWAVVVKNAEARNAALRSVHFPYQREPDAPLWDEATLRIADAVRKGQADPLPET